MEDKKYTLQELYKAGVISNKPFLYLDLSNKIKAAMLTGLKKSKAIREVALASGVTVRTCYRACAMITELSPRFLERPFHN